LIRRGFIFGLAEVLQEREGNHGEQRVVVEAGPGAPLEVVEAELFFHLLVGLLARPTRLERGHERLEGSVSGIVG
jgi:hypothetical protein